MAELKTQKTKASVAKFVAAVDHDQRKADAKELLKIFKDATGLKPAMWGESIIGYGQYHYQSERSTQEGDWPLTGFSPRKTNLSIYIMSGFKGKEKMLEKLGKHKHSVSCLHVNKLSDIDVNVLKKMIVQSVKEMKKSYGVK